VTCTASLFSFALAAALLAAHAAPAAPPLFKSKAKTDAARVRSLLEILKSDPDDKKRLTATAELGFADAREQPEVIFGLVAALKRDTSAKVRAGAADALGQLNLVSPVAGAALEAAATGDTVSEVRAASKQALWEYHLNGYRSTQGLGWLAKETEEPPIAAPPGPRVVVAYVPVAPAPAPAPKASAPLPPVPAPPLPPVAAPAGPRVVRSLFGDLVSSMKVPAKATAGPPPIVNVTPEPPLARPAYALTVPPVAPTQPPVLVPEPPVAPRAPDYVPTLPPVQLELPPVALPRNAAPEPAPRPVPSIPATLPAQK
jgi:hypothetical protein